jgi:uncharacterized spore protein YtfJ
MTTSGRVSGGEQRVEQDRQQARGVVPTQQPQEQAPERTLNDSLRRMFDSVRSEAVFGSPIERQGATLIPCSEVVTGFGMGGGSGFGPGTSGQTERASRTADGATGGGSGMGGGGGAQGRPVAMVVISGGDVRVLPILDMTKFMLAALTTAGFISFWLSQTLARSRASRRQGPSATKFARAMRSTSH